MHEERTFLSVKEAADYMRCSVETMRRWIRDDAVAIKGYRPTPASAYLVKKAELDTVLAESAHPEIAKAREELRITHD